MKLKNQLKHLAIFGGLPAFQEQLHVGRPNIGDRERFLERINDILDRKWLTNKGPYVQELEQRIANFLGVKHCIATSSGTVALEIGIRAADLKGEVIVPSMTFIATPHALQWLGINPVFCDIDPKTHNLNPKHIERMITPQTTGIIGVHLWGRSCDTEALTQIAQQRNLRLLYDAAHAFGCSHKGRMIGNFGDMEVFSFHATKFFNTLEGGAIVTNDDELATKIRLMKNFGFVGYDNAVSVGTNGKMNEVSAAMGITLLDNLDKLIAINHNNYKLYLQELEGIPGTKLVVYSETEKNNYQHIILEIDEAITHINRDQLVSILHAENVLARRYFYPGCHRMEPYRSISPDAGLYLPETEKLVKRLVSLPTGTAIGSQEIRKVCQIIRLAIAQGPKIKKKLNSQNNGRLHMSEVSDMSHLARDVIFEVNS